MVHFSLNIKAWCLYDIWEKQDQIWANIFCIRKKMHSRTPMFRDITRRLFHSKREFVKTYQKSF